MSRADCEATQVRPSVHDTQPNQTKRNETRGKERIGEAHERRAGPVAKLYRSHLQCTTPNETKRKTRRKERKGFVKHMNDEPGRREATQVRPSVHDTQPKTKRNQTKNETRRKKRIREAHERRVGPTANHTGHTFSSRHQTKPNQKTRQGFERKGFVKHMNESGRLEATQVTPSVHDTKPNQTKQKTSRGERMRE